MLENKVEFLKMEVKGVKRGIRSLRWIQIMFEELVGCERPVQWVLGRVSMRC
jgi:hypothetical protein